jgi:hypothetical protein
LDHTTSPKPIKHRRTPTDPHHLTIPYTSHSSIDVSSRAHRASYAWFLAHDSGVAAVSYPWAFGSSAGVVWEEESVLEQ